jgi:hypothetical protein
MRDIYLLFLQYFILYFSNVARKSTFFDEDIKTLPISFWLSRAEYSMFAVTLSGHVNVT